MFMSKKYTVETNFKFAILKQQFTDSNFIKRVSSTIEIKGHSGTSFTRNGEQQ